MVLWGPPAPVPQSPGVDWDYSVITGGLTVLLRFCVRAGDPDSGPQAGTGSTLSTELSPQPQFLSMLMFFTQASIPRIHVKCVIVLGSVLHGDFQNSFPNFLELLFYEKG